MPAPLSTMFAAQASKRPYEKLFWHDALDVQTTELFTSQLQHAVDGAQESSPLAR